MKKYIIPSIILLLLISVSFVAIVFAQEETAVEVEKTVKVEEAKASNLKEVVEFSAIVKGVGEVGIAPEISGRLTSIRKKEGETFFKGEILATIDDASFLAQNSVATQQVQTSKEALAGTDEYQEQLIDEAQIELEKAEDAKDEAKEGSDEVALELARKNVDKAEEAVKTAKRMRDLQLSLVQGQIDISQKQANVAYLNVDKTKIRAPFAGIFTKKLLQEGEIVSPQTTMFILVQSQEKEIKVDLPTNVAQKLAIGQEVFVARDGEDREDFLVRISSISPVSDEITRKSRVTFAFEKEDVILGEFVRILIPINEKNDIIAVPIDSVRKSYYENVLFVVEGDRVREEKVELGVIDKGMVEIQKGLAEGEVFVTDGQQNLRNGDKIRIYEK